MTPPRGSWSVVSWGRALLRRSRTSSTGNAMSSAERWLIVGLGNPGAPYEKTRHNVGFMVVDLLAQRHGIAVTTRKFAGLLGEGSIGDHRLLLLKPQTFMNDSGRSVQRAVAWYQSPLGRLIVIHDDLDLPLGRVRVRPDGSAGGHRGMQSIIQGLGSPQFGRVRIGIGRPAQGDVVAFVLAPFHDDERETVTDAVNRAADAVEEVLSHGFAHAMQVVAR